MSAPTKQFSKNKSLAAHFGGASNGQGGAQQGTRARGEQYLDGSTRSHTLSAPDLFNPTLNYFVPKPINVYNNYPSRVSDFSKQAHTNTDVLTGGNRGSREDGCIFDFRGKRKGYLTSREAAMDAEGSALRRLSRGSGTGWQDG